MSVHVHAHVELLVAAPNGAPLHPSEKSVLLALARYYSDEHKTAFCSLTRLAAITCLTRQGVVNALAGLVTHGLLSIERRCGPTGAHLANHYQFPTFTAPAVPVRPPTLVNSVDQGVVKSVDYPSQVTRLPLVKSVDYPSQVSRPLKNKKEIERKEPSVSTETVRPDAIAPATLFPLAVVEPKAPSEHQQLWQAFDTVFGPVGSDTERKRRAAACKDAAKGHSTGADIEHAAENWPNVMGQASMTEHGIVANLGKLLHGPQTGGRSNGTVKSQKPPVGAAALWEMSSLNRSNLRQGEQDADRLFGRPKP